MLDNAFINGSVVTADKNDSIVEAVGTKKNKIVFVGKNEEIKDFIGEKTRIIDLGGRTMCPGFIDTHYHPILNGFFGDTEDAAIINTKYENCNSIADILDLVRRVAKKRGSGAWISMMGYDQNKIDDKRHPTIEELDIAAPDNPVQCMRVCGHVAVYNTKAFEAAGIFDLRDAKRFPQNELEIKGGKLTGITKDSTHFYIWSKVLYTEEQQTAAALKSNELLLRNGITSVHDAGECGKVSYGIMQKLCREKKFKIRQYMMLHSIFGKPFSMSDNEHFLALGLRSGIGDEHFRIGSSKFMIDGGTGGPSCATRQPYSHDHKLPGILAWEREETANYICEINDSGCQATAHAVGDLAVEFMVEGYEKAFRRNPRPCARHRIEHCTIADEDLIRRMACMNICPSVNPGFIAERGSSYCEYYGDRMNFFSALRTMLDEGLMVSLASDAPSGPVEPMVIIDAAVNRVDRSTGEQVSRAQCITVKEAIKLYTYNGAYSSYEEEIKGSIEVGKLADLTVLSQDILQYPREKIRDIDVDMTFIDGILEYERSI